MSRIGRSVHRSHSHHRISREVPDDPDEARQRHLVACVHVTAGVAACLPHLLLHLASQLRMSEADSGLGYSAAMLARTSPNWCLAATANDGSHIGCARWSSAQHYLAASPVLRSGTASLPYVLSAGTLDYILWVPQEEGM